MGAVSGVENSSAHSFNGKERSWNVANNSKYIQSLDQETLPSTIEKLSAKDQYNEYVMTGLRTVWGISLNKIEKEFGLRFKDHLLKEANIFLQQGLLEIISDNLLKTDSIEKMKITDKGKFLADGIA